MKHARIIIALLMLLGASSLAEAQIVVSSTTASTTRLHEKSGREKGWVISPEVGISKKFYMANVTAAYQFNPYLSIGGGIGLEYRNDNLYLFDSIGMMSSGERYSLMSLPIYANTRVYFCDRKLSPFLDLKAGYQIPVTESDVLYAAQEALEGLFAIAMLGVQYKNIDLGVDLAYFNAKGYYPSLETILVSLAYNFQFKKK